MVSCTSISHHFIYALTLHARDSSFPYVISRRCFQLRYFNLPFPGDVSVPGTSSSKRTQVQLAFSYELTRCRAGPYRHHREPSSRMTIRNPGHGTNCNRIGCYTGTYTINRTGKPTTTNTILSPGSTEGLSGCEPRSPAREWEVIPLTKQQ